MAPPFYADLGKASRDVFSKGYNFGHLRADVTCKSGDFEFKTNCIQNIGTGKLFGGIDVKYKVPNQGITLSEKWNTDNVLSTECVIDEKLLKGSKIIIDSAYAPYVGKRSGKIKTEYKHERTSLGGDFQLDSTGSKLFNGHAVIGITDNWLLGFSVGADAAKNKLTHRNFSVAYDSKDLGVHAFVNNLNEFGANFFVKAANQVDIGASLSWTSGENVNRYGLAAKYELDKDTSIRAKINNQSMLGIGLMHTLKPGLKLIISSSMNLADLNNTAHKVGFGIEYEPAPRK